MEKHDIECSYRHREATSEILISPYVYDYLSDVLANIPEDKNKPVNYYLCFSGTPEKNNYSYKCKLKDSRLMVLEKE